MGLPELETPKPRRAPTRRAPPSGQTKPKNGKSKGGPSWFAQSLGILAGAFAVFFFASLVALEVGATNPMGPIGKVSATLARGLMGLSSYLLVGWLFYLSAKLWTKGFTPKEDVPGKLVRGLGVVGVIVSISVSGTLFGGGVGGGSVGSFIAIPLQRFLGFWGGLLVSSTVLVLSLTLVTDLRFRQLVLVVKDLFLLTIVLILITVPRLIWGGILALGRAVQRLLSLLTEISFAFISRFRGKNDQPSNLLLRTKPRIRKSRGIEQAELGADDEEVHEVGDIKVRRKQLESLAKVDRVRGGKKVIKDTTEESEDDQGFFTGAYEVPKLDLLIAGTPLEENEDDRALLEKSRQIESKLKDFGISGRVTEVHPGPVITLFEFEPAAGVKVGRIASLSDDLAMSLKAFSVRILAPIPGKGTVGIEVPNVQRELVRLRDVLQSPESVRAASVLSVAVGKDTRGDAVVADLSDMPHLLIAGATGTGKSVCINAILLSLLYRATPLELGLIMIDPKILELSVYDGIPHLRVPVVTVPRQAKAVLEWAVNEMNRRYRVMQKLGVRSIDGYNRVVAGEEEAIPGKNEEQAAKAEELQDGVLELNNAEVVTEGTEAGVAEESRVTIIAEKLKPLPKIVIVIDELADLMLTVGREIEDLITRLAQKARASGIHLIVATQRPSVDVITGLIKANFPARLSFQVSSRVDSRTIIDTIGAEKLLGRGDMLFMPPGVGSLKRVHGAFVSDTEVKKVVAALKKNCTPNYDQAIMEMCERALKEDDGKGGGSGEGEGSEYDPLFDQAVQAVLEKGQASTSMIQRIFRIGYNRAARIIEQMERDGIVGPADGAKPRSVIGGRDSAGEYEE